MADLQNKPNEIRLTNEGGCTSYQWDPTGDNKKCLKRTFNSHEFGSIKFDPGT